MTLEQGVSQILVRSLDGHIHVADFSDITARQVTDESKREAIAAYLAKHHLTALGNEEAMTHGYTNELLEKRHKRTWPPQRIRFPHR